VDQQIPEELGSAPPQSINSAITVAALYVIEVSVTTTAPNLGVVLPPLTISLSSSLHDRMEILPNNKADKPNKKVLVFII